MVTDDAVAQLTVLNAFVMCRLQRDGVEQAADGAQAASVALPDGPTRRRRGRGRGRGAGENGTAAHQTTQKQK